MSPPNSGSLTMTNVPKTPNEALALLSEAAKRAAPTWATLDDSGRCLFAVQFLRQFIADAEKMVADLNKQLAECHAKMARLDPATDLKKKLTDSDQKRDEAGTPSESAKPEAPDSQMRKGPKPGKGKRGTRKLIASKRIR